MAFGPTNLQGLNMFLALQSAMPPNGGAPQAQQQPQAPGGAPQGIDIAAAFRTGEQAAKGDVGQAPRGYAMGGPVRGYDAGGMVDDGSDDGDDDGLGSISPMLMALTKRQLAQEGGDVPLTSQDRGLALAQMGFGIAGGTSPNALQNIGQGASYGLTQLQKIKQARALQRMRESEATQALTLKQAALMDAAKQKSAALAQAKDIADQRSADTKAALEEKTRADKANEDIKSALAVQAASTADDKAAALKENRYTVNDRQRRAQYQASGQWQKIAGDDEHAVSGPPEEDKPFSGPQVEDPTLPLKARNSMKLAKPKQTQAIQSLDLTFNNIEKNATELLSHPGLEGAVGFRMGQEYVPGTDAATFKAKLDSLKSQVFAQSIQAMRDASRTGGAVGNVSDREGQRFEAMLGTLSQAQDEKSFKESLKNILSFTDHLRGTYHDAYDSVYGGLPQPKEPKPPSPPSDNGAGVGSPTVKKRVWIKDPNTGVLRPE